ncbi:hypothetical protein DL96DRAFT_1273945 [Flagelloscypha sp. PMI_526]|nr:hypothetical protein DL96DRAFT_1273945 [Flagelloscypha sp. PMI_526]
MSFQDIPKDLARDIFELAAHPDRLSARATSLSLVSREVQSWTDICLFRNIAFKSTMRTRAERSFLDAIISDDRSPRLEQARKYVRTISSQDQPDPEGLIERFVSVCPLLESIALWHMSPKSQMLNLSISSLRKMTFYDDMGKDSLHFSLRYPLFHSLTHLDLGGWSYKDWPRIRNAGIREMTSITHLVLSGLSDGSIRVTEIISEMSSHLPPNLHLLFLLLDEGQVEELLMIGASFHYDSRVVVAIDDPDFGSFYEALGVHVNDGIAWTSWTGETKWEESFWCQSNRLRDAKRLLEASTKKR